MKLIRTAILILLILLALAAGAAKVMQMPQELEFFSTTLGLGATVVVAFGALQMLAGVLMTFAKTRLPGALLLDVTLVFSAALVFISGNISFGLVSLVPVVLNSLLIVDMLMARSRLRETQL
ncbi:MAG: hypothetical protein AB8G18_05705 [Gammaproteobacteria bacterium]